MSAPQRCKQELCPNWSGDGNVCPCALFDLDPSCVQRRRLVCDDDLCHGVDQTICGLWAGRDFSDALDDTDPEYDEDGSWLPL